MLGTTRRLTTAKLGFSFDQRAKSTRLFHTLYFWRKEEDSYLRLAYLFYLVGQTDGELRYSVEHRPEILPHLSPNEYVPSKGIRSMFLSKEQ